MATQSNLERIAIDERKEELIRSPFDYNENNKYEAGHKNATADGDAKGKGTGIPLGTAELSHHKDTHKTAHIDYSTMDTTSAAGGKYDTDGTQGVQGAFQGDAGRKYLSSINLYDENNEYGTNSVDTSANRAEGQYWVE